MKAIHKYIFQPIPDLTETPVPDSQEDRLKIIIANLEKQHQRVRASILASAQKEVEDLRAKRAASRSHTNGDHNVIGSGTMLATQNPANALLLANLSASAPTPPQDPCLLHGTTPTAPAGMSQAPAPLEIEVAKHAIEQIEAYDRHAKQTIDYYRKALRYYRESRAQSGGRPVGATPGMVERPKDPRLAGRKGG